MGFHFIIHQYSAVNHIIVASFVVPRIDDCLPVIVLASPKPFHLLLFRLRMLSFVPAQFCFLHNCCCLSNGIHVCCCDLPASYIDVVFGCTCKTGMFYVTLLCFLLLYGLHLKQSYLLLHFIETIYPG